MSRPSHARASLHVVDGDIAPLWVREFDIYVRTRGPRLLSIAHLLVDGREAAEDLYQEVLVKALLAWPRVRRADDIDAYLRRALVNARASWWWRRRREVLMADAT